MSSSDQGIFNGKYFCHLFIGARLCFANSGYTFFLLIDLFKKILTMSVFYNTYGMLRDLFLNGLRGTNCLNKGHA
jgi:hypothetical protein